MRGIGDTLLSMFLATIWGVQTPTVGHGPLPFSAGFGIPVQGEQEGGTQETSIAQERATGSSRPEHSEATVAFVVERLSSPKHDVRLAAAEALVYMKSRHSVPALLAALEDEHSDVRMTSVMALDNIQDRRAVKPLIGLLKDERPSMQSDCIRALGRIGGDEALAAILARNGDEDSEMRCSCAWALAKFDHPEAIAAVLKVLRSKRKDESHYIRQSAVEGMFRERYSGVGVHREPPPPEYEEALFGLLNDPVHSVREAVAHRLGYGRSLRAIEWAIQEFGNERDEWYWNAHFILKTSGSVGFAPMVAALTDASSIQVERILNVLYTHGGDGALSRAAAMHGQPETLAGRALEKALLRDKDVEVLIRELRSEDRKVAYEASRRLRLLEAKEAIPHLVEQINNPEQLVRRDVVLALGRMGAREHLDAVISQMHDEKSNVRSAAVRALGDMGDLRAVRPLLAALRTKGYFSGGIGRTDVINALGELGDDRAIPTLVGELGNRGYRPVRKAAIAALADCGGRSVIGHLLPMLEDEDDKVRKAAIVVLARFPEDRVVDAIIARLSDREGEVRVAAAKALGEFGDRRAVDVLRQSLLDNNASMKNMFDNPRKVVEAAHEALLAIEAGE